MYFRLPSGGWLNLAAVTGIDVQQRFSNDWSIVADNKHILWQDAGKTKAAAQKKLDEVIVELGLGKISPLAR